MLKFSVMFVVDGPWAVLGGLGGAAELSNVNVTGPSIDIIPLNRSRWNQLFQCAKIFDEFIVVLVAPLLAKPGI